MTARSFFQVFHSVLNSIKEEPKDDKMKISEDCLQMLNYLFGDDDNLANALQLIDSKRIHLLRSESSRQVFKVLGHGRTSYICYKHAYYCTCPAFKHKVINSNDWLMCKHLLATRIADAMGLIEIENITDQQMLDTLLGNSADQEIIQV